MNDTVIVITGAEPLASGDVGWVPDDAIVIAADGALDAAVAAGLEPATLVGDLDSISAAGLAWAEANATIQRHDPDKDRTDTELALAAAVALDPDRVVLLSGGGDRLDHTFAAIGALGHPSLTSVPDLEARWAGQRIVVVHGPGRARLDIEPGHVVSLLALHGPCTGVGVTGVAWPLSQAELAPMSGHGVSNVAVEPTVEIVVSTGVLTVFVDPPITSSAEPPGSGPAATDAPATPRRPPTTSTTEDS